MSEVYEGYISELETATFPRPEVIEAALDSLTFLVALNTLLRENGADLPEDPDADKIGNVLDGMFGELAAASIFLTEDAFARVPEMLRGVAKTFDRADVPFTDPSGTTSQSVPRAVIQGFRDLATRLDSTKVQKALLLDQLKRFQAENA